MLRNKGFTLIEVLVLMILSVLIMSPLFFMFNTSSNYLSSLKKKTLYYNNIEQILIDNDSIFDIVHDKNWQTGSILGLNNEVKFKGKFDDEYKNLNFLHFYIGSEKTTAYFNFVEFVIYEE